MATERSVAQRLDRFHAPDRGSSLRRAASTTGARVSGTSSSRHLVCLLPEQFRLATGKREQLLVRFEAPATGESA
jgi:hypothetical protein